MIKHDGIFLHEKVCNKMKETAQKKINTEKLPRSRNTIQKSSRLDHVKKYVYCMFGYSSSAVHCTDTKIKWAAGEKSAKNQFALHIRAVRAHNSDRFCVQRYSFRSLVWGWILHQHCVLFISISKTERSQSNIMITWKMWIDRYAKADEASERQREKNEWANQVPEN